jgi:hypothetical protein
VLGRDRMVGSGSGSGSGSDGVSNWRRLDIERARRESVRLADQ